MHAFRMSEILQLADHHGIPVIEDAAESLGSTYKGTPVGTLGDIGIYSFNNNKVVTTYGGGAITLKSSELAQKVRFTQVRPASNCLIMSIARWATIML
jgi:pyridoxal phosphate-dependent aminotransferase EpsN